jgi:hypothetical protein
MAIASLKNPNTLSILGGVVVLSEGWKRVIVNNTGAIFKIYNWSI